MSDRKKILIVLFFVFIIFPLCVSSAKGVLSDEAKVCLTCHSHTGMSKTLENKEVLSLYVDKEEFAKSAHNSIDCNGCHTGYLAAHLAKKKQIKSIKEYSVNASQVCSMCHPDDQLKKIPIHSSVMTKAACVECHGSHNIKKMAEWKKGINETQYCLTCHRHDLSMTLSSGEALFLSINESVYKSSVHGSLLCSSCHTDFSTTKHPVRTFKNKREYSALVTKSCSMCHSDEQLRKSPVHSSLLAKASCVECHGSHSIKGIAAQKAAAPETQYCLSCHKGKLSMSFKSGESVSVFVDELSLRSSVHGKLRCTECHTEFSKSKHPVKVFKDRRDYSITTSDICGRCHSDAYTKYKGSIHLSLLKSGNLKAPACTDCHGFHSVSKAGNDLGLASCNKCHSDMKNSYEASVHNRARIQGKKDAPVCSSCHNAHNIESTRMTTKIKEGCFKCHKDMGKVHDKWLKNPPITLSTFAEAHFDVVSCAACHSPNAKRRIYLSLSDCKTGKPLTEEEVIKILNIDAAGLMGKIDINSDGSVDGKEVWNIFWLLLNKGVRTTFMGKMDVSNATEAHQLGTKVEATRDCEKCHQPNSPYFENVFVAISKADGKTTLLPAKKGVLNSIYSIIPIRKFYAIGGTNISLFDILFYVALIGGIAVPIGHITLRIVFSPIKSLRRMGKGGKK
ncbi:MAG TPA: cytochrome c3 family protein [Thermodesulfovibrionales bacterium]|nr:cytochrome c3 family protein [Thermodesulfovibrionales bacterium]